MISTDPFGDRTEPACARVKEREWWYRTDVDMPSVGPRDRLILDFEGLDTFATIWLNGDRIGTTDNMFRQWRVDVTPLVRDWVKRKADDHGIALLARGTDAYGTAFSTGVSRGTGPRLEVYVR